MKIVLRELFYISNLLSITRILVIPPLAYFIKINTPAGNRVIIALVVWSIVSDYLDGYTARKLSQQTELGRILDPLADKIAMIVVLAFMVLYRHFPVTLVLVLAYRDIMILIMGTIVSRKIGRVLEANLLGKINTCVVAATILFFLLGLRNYIMTALIVLSYLSIAVSGLAYYRFGENYLVTRTSSRYLLRTALLVVAAGLLAACGYFRFTVFGP